MVIEYLATAAKVVWYLVAILLGIASVISILAVFADKLHDNWPR